MRQLAVGGGGRLAVGRHNVLRWMQTGNMCVCVLKAEDECLYVCDCVLIFETAHVLERWCVELFCFAVYFIMTFGMSLEKWSLSQGG